MKNKTKKRLRRVLPRGIVNFVKSIQRKLSWFKYRIKWIKNYGRYDFFEVINIEINTACNRKCSYCPNYFYNKKSIKNNKLMKFSLFKKLIDELATIDFRGEIAPHFYGEPLLNKNLIKFIRYAKKKIPKTRIIITSNGDFLDIKKYKELVSAGVDGFVVTQHSENMNENIKLLFAYFKKHPSKKVKFHYEHFEEDRPLFNRGGLVKPKVVCYVPICSYPENPLVIDYSGNVLLCCNDYFGQIKLGNIKNQSLLKIWRSREYKKLRKQLKNKKYIYSICRKCVGQER